MLSPLPLLPVMGRPNFASAGVGTNPTSANCKGWWSLDDASGSFVDSMGLATLNTVVGSPTYGVAAKVGNGISLAGTAYASKASSNPIITNWPLSVAGWINTSAATGVMFSTGVSTASNQYFRLMVNSNKLLLQVRNGGGVQSITSAANVNTGALIHVAAIITSATERRIYINASAVAGGSGLTSISYATSNHVVMGTSLISSAATNTFAGTLDEWCVFNDVITADELTWLYNAGTGRAFSEL